MSRFARDGRVAKEGFRVNLLLGVLWVTFPVLIAQGAEGAKRPNVLVILADDLGYSDVGCYGGEIATPRLDELARNGLRFTQFYNTARCWPSRAALLTGYYAQQVRRDALPKMKGGSAGQRPSWARLLPELIRPHGYRSYHSGKWHVDGKPLENGFDHSYSLEDHNRNFSPQLHLEDDVRLPDVPRGTDYYASTAIVDHAVKCLKEHESKHAGEPFFSYVAFNVPHFPLQAPAVDIARYHNRYVRGWEIERTERWARMQKEGIGGSVLAEIERHVGPPHMNPKVPEKVDPGEILFPLKWEGLNTRQHEFQSIKMAIHAAMVDRMDQEIGRVIDQVRAMKAMDDTLVMFMSDNGASAELLVRGDGHDPQAAPGSAGSFLCLGPGWSSHANAPFRRHKTWVHEGGISTPLIVHWPRGIAAKGELRHTPAHLIDLVPTIFEAIGLQMSEKWNGKEIPARPGKSLVPV
ncbi:MAG: sulfatase-like hydrolase/transferase, partial [Planctomycetaceae bacterium]|nr:sulfatase-like hydrolase/transferase [Planctomycetaceae bacterium]